MTRGERRKVRRWKGANQDYDKVQDSAEWLPRGTWRIGAGPRHPVPWSARGTSDKMIHEWTRVMQQNGAAVGMTEPPSRM